MGRTNIPILEAPKGRRDEFVDPYFRRATPGSVAVTLKAREPAIMIAIGDKVAVASSDRGAFGRSIQLYINDRDWGRMFVRICPYRASGCPKRSILL
jgi:hypothetical protein